MNMTPDTLIAQISNAFPQNPAPSDKTLLYEGAYPGESELEEIKSFFAFRPWNSVTAQDVFRFRHALPLFSPSARAYFTAAWMTASLQDEDAVDTGTEDLISNLGRSDPKIWTADQRAAICQWLAYFKTRWQGFLAREIEAVETQMGCRS
jgi:hypothetical protein